MKIKKLLGLAVIILAVVLGVRTYNHSVYYAAQEAPLIPVEQLSADTTTTTVSASPATTTQTKADTSTTPASSSNTNSHEPTRLLIPSLSIDAHVQETSLNTKGNMGTPTNFTDVAWYKPGTTPGDIGSAVIDGHVDNGLSLAGVFKHLEDINVGDDVYITDASGQKLHFQVIDKQEYSYTDSSVNQLVFNRKDASRLNLITCTGDWVPGQKTYDKRLVVFTKLVG